MYVGVCQVLPVQSLMRIPARPISRVPKSPWNLCFLGLVKNIHMFMLIADSGVRPIACARRVVTPIRLQWPVLRSASGPPIA